MNPYILLPNGNIREYRDYDDLRISVVNQLVDSVVIISYHRGDQLVLATAHYLLSDIHLAACLEEVEDRNTPHIQARMRQFAEQEFQQAQVAQ